MPFKKNTLRPIAFLNQPSLGQRLDHTFEPIVIKTFTQGMVEGYAEPLVGGVDLRQAGGQKLVPQRFVLKIASVQRRRFGKHFRTDYFVGGC